MPTEEKNADDRAEVGDLMICDALLRRGLGQATEGGGGGGTRRTLH
jgi:hypothetical protein